MTRSRSARTATASLALALLLVGCASGPGPEAVDEQSPSPTASEATPTTSGPGGGRTESPSQTAEPAPPVPDALRFEATTVSGDAFEGASVAGRPVVVWFWAPWCAVCRSQVPEVTGLSEEYGDEVAFLGVGSLDSSDAIASFADDVPGLTHLSDPDGELYQRFGIAEQSSFVVLDAAGDEVLRTGYSDDDELAGTVAELAG